MIGLAARAQDEKKISWRRSNASLCVLARRIAIRLSITLAPINHQISKRETGSIHVPISFVWCATSDSTGCESAMS
jgi:hypothetical protein